MDDLKLSEGLGSLYTRKETVLYTKNTHTHTHTHTHTPSLNYSGDVSVGSMQHFMLPAKKGDKRVLKSWSAEMRTLRFLSILPAKWCT